MKKLLLILLFLICVSVYAQESKVINFDPVASTWQTITVNDSLILYYLASDNLLVLTPTATGDVDTLETTDIATSDITVTGLWTFDNLVADSISVDTITVNSAMLPDADDGANIGATATRFNLVYADSVHAAWFGGSDFELGEVGSKITVDADSLMLSNIASSSTLVLTTTSDGKIDTMETVDYATEDITVTGLWTFDNVVIDSANIDTAVVTGQLNVTGSAVFEDTLRTTGYFIPGKVIHSYMAFDDSSTTLTMSTDAWAQVTNATDSLFQVLETDLITYILGDTLQIVYPGDYKGIISLSFSGTASDAYEIAIFKNGSIATPKMERTTSQNDVGNVTLALYIEDLVATDKLTFEIRNTASDDDATLISCSWWMELAHL